MERLAEIMRQIAALADEAAQLAGIDPGGETGAGLLYPRLATIDGATLMLQAPIAKDWAPSREARELTRYGSFGEDPSNGSKYGQPLRSPAGYPLVYTPDGFGGFRQVQVNYDGVNFPDDAAVAAYKVAVANRNANLARVGGTFSPHPR